MPPLAIIIARYLDHLLSLPDKNETLKIRVRILSVVNMILGIGFSLFLLFSKTEISPLLAFTASAFFITGLTLFFANNHVSSRNIIALIIVSSYISFTSAWLTTCTLSKDSIKPLALTINTLMKKHPDAEIVNYDFYRQDLPYYTQHIVTVVGNLNKNDFNELTYGIRHDKKSQQWMISSKIFWKRWNSRERLYVVMKLKLYKKTYKKFGRKVRVIQSTSNDILITNKEVT